MDSHITINLVLICGRPRAGKTTYSRKKYSDVMHLDYFGRLPENYKKLLEKIPDRDTVVEGIYNTQELRNELLERFNGRKTCIWLDTSIETIRERYPKYAQLRNFPYPFEPPTYAEGWDEIIRIT